MENTEDSEVRYEITEQGKLHLKSKQTYIVEYEAKAFGEVVTYKTCYCHFESDTLKNAKVKFLSLNLDSVGFPVFMPMGKILTKEAVQIIIDEYTQG